MPAWCRHCDSAVCSTESLAAHERAIALESNPGYHRAPHLLSARWRPEATIETYAPTGYYLDTGARVALGSTSRAVTLLADTPGVGAVTTIVSRADGVRTL